MDEWLYRPVKVRGRPIHKKDMKFRVDRYGFVGSMHFVPLVTNEDDDASHESREGLLLGLGWIPHNFDDVSNRFRFENSHDYQEFTGIVTTNEELAGRNSQANIYDEQKFDVRHYYLPELAKASGLKNQDVVSLAAIERVNLDTPNDEKNPRHYDIDLTATEQFPYVKTRSGALQNRMMPWDYQHRIDYLTFTAIASTLLGLACKVPK